MKERSGVRSRLLRASRNKRDLTPSRIVRLETDAVGVALAAARGEDLDAAYEELVSTRPTAVNLRWALDEMRADPSPEHARAIHEAEVERCRRMAAHAADLVQPGARVLTHCNTRDL